MIKFLILIFSFCISSCYANETKASSKKNTSFIHDIAGMPSQDCLYLGMWTYHFDSRWRGRNDNWFNNALGIQYNGIFVTTLINSHYNRCLTFGITRDWIAYKPFNHTKITFGYRLGGIYGYGKELNKYAEMFPVMPIYQICTQIQYRKFRIEFSYYRSLLSCYLTLLYGDY